MKPPVAVFSKEKPCSKLQIWNAFRGRRAFGSVLVVDAQAQIGVNVPRIMEREGRLVRREVAGQDIYTLTPDGEGWLFAGMQAYLKNHPADVEKANFLPRGFLTRPR